MEVWVVDLTRGRRWHPLLPLGTHTECGQAVARGGRIVDLAQAKALGMGECGWCYRLRKKRGR